MAEKAVPRNVLFGVPNQSSRSKRGRKDFKQNGIGALPPSLPTHPRTLPAPLSPWQTWQTSMKLLKIKEKKQILTRSLPTLTVWQGLWQSWMNKKNATNKRSGLEFRMRTTSRTFHSEGNRDPFP